MKLDFILEFPEYSGFAANHPVRKLGPEKVSIGLGSRLQLVKKDKLNLS